MHEPFDAAIARVAAGQHGALTRVQAASAGLSRDAIAHRLRTGRWVQPARGVFVIAGAPASWRQTLIVACFAWGSGAVASHRSAAALWGLPGGREAVVELTVPRNRRRSRTPDAIVHSGALGRGERRWRDGIELTTPARTLIDLGAVVRADLLEEALDDALRRGLVSRVAMRTALNAAGRRRGVVAFRRLMAERDGQPFTESVFETRLLRMILRAGLPAPLRQHELRDVRGRLIARVDFAYPQHRIAIEADGYRWHAGRARWVQDRARLTRLAAVGWRVVHVTWDQMRDDPDAVIAAIVSALG